MLGVKTYEKDYVAACWQRLTTQLAALDTLAADSPASDEAQTEILQALTVELDAFFVHRVRALEGKDGNPVNEVRMLAHSLLHNNGILTANTTIRYRAENAVLAITIGQPIRMDRAGFRRLATAYFDSLKSKFT